MHYREQIARSVGNLMGFLAFHPFQTNFRGDAGCSKPYYSDHYDYKADPPRPITMLRFDWEMSTESLDGYPKQRFHDVHAKAIDLLADHVVMELIDLVENGDMDSDDYLYRRMNGIGKRGKEPVEVYIDAATLFWEFHERKDTREYTLYLNLYVQW